MSDGSRPWTWMALANLLEGALNQDWHEEHDTPEQAIDANLAEWSLHYRRLFLEECDAFIERYGDSPELASHVWDSLGVSIVFADHAQVRAFMKMVRERIADSVRAEKGLGGPLGRPAARGAREDIGR